MKKYVKSFYSVSTRALEISINKYARENGVEPLGVSLTYANSYYSALVVFE